MRAGRTMLVMSLAVAVGCGRSSMRNLPAAQQSGAGGGEAGHSGGAAGATVATGGQTGTSVAEGGVAGSTAGNGRGGAGGAGGMQATGGAGATAGTGGLIGAGGAAPVGSGAGPGGTVVPGGTGSGGAIEPSCGNGVVDPGETCDLGSGNTEAPAFLVSQAGMTFAATPLARIPSAGDFYNYTSASAHTGLEGLGESHIFLYFERSTASLSLFVIHGIDANTSAEDQPRSNVKMVLSGLPYGAIVAVSDDRNELTMTSDTSATGKWVFSSNSDGGAISGLPYPDTWQIYLSPAFVDGIFEWTWLQGDGSVVALDMDQPLTITAASSPSSCRLDCSLPRCGDGILDGGEICDSSSDTCSADCTAFE